MDRFQWDNGVIGKDENTLITQKNVRLYDGDQKSAFDKGTATLTSHRILWTDANDSRTIISLPLKYITSTDRISSGFTRSAKVVLHLLEKDATANQGPISSSPFHFVYLSFSSGGDSEYLQALTGALGDKKFLSKSPPHVSKRGIVGIEQGREEVRGSTDKTISIAFQDLSQLMRKAKEMVAISRSISQKLSEGGNGVSQDETRKFKSYLMSLGVEDPITRDTSGSGEEYYEQLANQVAAFLAPVLEEQGGIMTLTDVYCRVNRARGMELLSPEDLERCCGLMASLGLSVRMKAYGNGVKVLQLTSHDETALAEETLQLTHKFESVSSDELASAINCSVLLAKQRLLVAEELGKLCRDESNQGLRFFPNLFITPS